MQLQSVSINNWSETLEDHEKAAELSTCLPENIFSDESKQNPLNHSIVFLRNNMVPHSLSCQLISSPLTLILQIQRIFFF